MACQSNQCLVMSKDCVIVIFMILDVTLYFIWNKWMIKYPWVKVCECNWVRGMYVLFGWLFLQCIVTWYVDGAFEIVHRKSFKLMFSVINNSISMFPLQLMTAIQMMDLVVMILIMLMFDVSCVINGNDYFHCLL